MPSRSVRPLQDRGIPDGPKRIMGSRARDVGGQYYSVGPDIKALCATGQSGMPGHCRVDERRHSRSERSSRVPSREPSGPGPAIGNDLTLLSLQMFIAGTPLSPLPRFFSMPTPFKTNPRLRRVVQELRDLSRENQVAVWRGGGGPPRRAPRDRAGGEPPPPPPHPPHGK